MGELALREAEELGRSVGAAAAAPDPFDQLKTKDFLAEIPPIERLSEDRFIESLEVGQGERVAEESKRDIGVTQFPP